MTLTRLPTASGPVGDGVDALLVGAPDRWQPSRCGVVNAWQYTNETLQFENGRLLLHGPNGSGKTMLLEMLWPFLLEANTRPSRLSTGGTDRGTLANRLTGYTNGTARTSFLWAEFTRRTDDGAPPAARPVETFTIGVRCRVPANGKTLDRCWFTTDQRIGHDLSLLDDGHRPISIDQLQERIEAAPDGRGGTLWRQDEAAYRRAVGERLFTDHTDESFARLIETVLVVRQKEITSRIAKSGSARAQARELAGHLTAALPPLEEREVERAAAGFERLDRRRAQIEELEGQQHVLTTLGTAAKAFARVQLLRVGQRARSAHTEFDRVTKAERQATADLDGATAAAERLDAALQQAEDDQADTRSALYALRQSDAYGAARELVTLSERVDALRRAADTAHELADARRSAVEDAGRRVKQARGDLDRATTTVARSLEELGEALGRALLDRLGEGVSAGPDGLDDTATALAHASALLDRRAEEVTTMTTVLRAHVEAVATRDRAEEAREKARERHDTSARAHRDARGRAVEAIDQWTADVRVWVSSRSSLPVVLPPRLLDELVVSADDDVDQVEGLLRTAWTRVGGAITAAVSRAQRRVVTRRADLAARRERLTRQRAEAAGRLAALRDGTSPPPAVPPWRRDRTGRTGAPLYACVDAVDGVSDKVLDTVEAVLAQTGLLDGWVDPAGTVAGDDVTLVPSRDPAPGPTLADVLVVDPESPVPAAAVAALLRSVGLSDGGVTDGAAATRPEGPAMVLGLDGSWRLGPAAGRATPSPAAHIGTAARERRRRQLIAALEAELADMDRHLAAVDADLAELAATDRALDIDAAGAPDTTTVPLGPWRDSRARLDQTVEDLDDAEAAVGAATTELRLRQEALHRQVAGTGLPADADVLEAVGLAVRDARGLIGTTRTGVEEVRRKAARLAEEEQEVVGRAAAQTAATADAEAADRDHRDQQVQLEQLRTISGAAIEEVRAQVQSLEAHETVLRTKTLPDLRGQRQAHAESAATARATLARTTEDRQRAEEVRGAAFTDVQQALEEGLADDADIAAAVVEGVEVETVETITQTRAAVTAICRELEGARVPGDDAALNRTRARLAQEIHEAKHSIARFNIDPEVRWIGSLEVFRLAKDGRLLRQTEAARELRAELDSARAELDAVEEEAFRSTLAGGLRQHLADRLRTATGMVTAMNSVLAGIATRASNVTVSLRWIVDPAVDSSEAVARFRTLLLTDAPTEAERAELHGFLRRRIQQLEAQADTPEDLGSWASRLGRILDYRQWHTFEVRVGHAGRPAPTTFGNRNLALSTGEHALVLVLPLLAAVTAHYLPRAGSASRCPRLLVMDEVFPTVDAENKRQLFGLMSALDLDYVMTSDKEWCTYDTVDGIAIHSVQKDGDESFTTRFTWDGRERRSAPVVEAADSAGSLL